MPATKRKRKPQVTTTDYAVTGQHGRVILHERTDGQQFWGGYSIVWAVPNIAHVNDLAPRGERKRSAEDARRWLLTEARDRVERFRLDHLNDKQLAAVDLLQQRLDDELREANGRPKKPRPTQIDAALNDPDRVDLSPESANVVVDLPMDKLHDHPGNPDPEEADVVAMMDALSRGQDEALTVRPLSDPVGHYQVIGGKTRRAAAARLGWDTLACRIRTDLDGDAGDLFAARNNLDRRVESVFRKAQWLQYFVGRGQSLKEIGHALYGWSEGYARSMVGLLKLPEPWKTRVVSGEMLPTVACRLNPYAAIRQLMEAFDRDFKSSGYVRDLWLSKADIGDRIKTVIDQVSRPVGGKTTHHYGYPCLFQVDELSEADRKRLNIQKLPIGPGGKVVERALGYKFFDKLQEPLIVAKLKAEAERPTKAARKAAEAQRPKKVTAEQKAAKERERAEARAAQLSWSIDGWRLTLLRRLIAERLDDVDSPWTDRLIPLCLIWFGDAAKRFLPAAMDLLTGDGRIDGFDRYESAADLHQIYWDWSRRANCDCARLLAVLVSRLLWPVYDDCEYPDEYDLPDIDADAVEQIASEMGGVDVRSAWARMREADSPLRVHLRAFLCLHNEDELRELKGKGETKEELVESLMKKHTGKRGLPVPRQSKRRRREP